MTIETSSVGLAAEDVQELREDLRRELERLATAEIKASRTESDRADRPK